LYNSRNVCAGIRYRVWPIAQGRVEYLGHAFGKCGFPVTK